MAKFTFTAESDDLAEIAMLVDRMVAGGMDTPVAPRAVTTPAPEPEVAATKTRGPRKAKAEEVAEPAPAPEEPAATAAEPSPADSPQADSASSAPTADPAPAAEEHPLLAEVTLQDIKDKASEVMKKDPKAGAAIMAKLKDRFGVAAFSQVPAEDRARCMAMLAEF